MVKYCVALLQLLSKLTVIVRAFKCVLNYVYMKKEREENPRVFALLRFYSVTLGGLIERGPRILKGVRFKRNWGAALVGSITNNLVLSAELV